MKALARFAKPWLVKAYADGFTVLDATGTYICGVGYRDDLHKTGWTLADKYLTKEEAEELATAISKIE